MFRPGTHAGVAVSGGADSVCLLHVLAQLAPELGVSLRVLHLDHNLRGEESRADAAFVSALAGRLGLPFRLASADVRGMAANDNLEQAARRARRAFFLREIEGGLDRIALGHTRSDQAETVLYRFLRGAGTAGLAGILPVTAEGLVRPLIGIDREEVRVWLARRGIPWREDSSNADLAFDRNRIRRVLLPELAREWNPALTATLANVADWAREEEAYWEREVARIAPGLLAVKPPAVLVDAAALARFPAAVARRIVRRAIELAKGDLRAVGFDHVRAILELAAAPGGSGRLQVPGVDVFRSFDWLRLAPPAAFEPREFAVPLPVPGRAELPAGAALAAEVVENNIYTSQSDSVYNDGVGCLNWSRVSAPLLVRNWTPGDRYQPVGYSGEEKVKTLFQRARIPLWERRRWPVLTGGGEIVWVLRFGPSAACAVEPETRSVLRLRYSSE
jgi:tRNA(Ile)-lysidine synthase